MKKIHSCILIVVFFIIPSLGLVSCSSEAEITPSENVNTTAARSVTNSPENDVNPYDEAGMLYEELFDTYYCTGNVGGSISQIIYEVQSIADANLNFNLIKDFPYQNVSSSRVQYLLENPTSCVNDVISTSSMSLIGKSSLSTFINQFIPFLDTESNCDIIYQKIVAYENAVLLSGLFTENDKRIILTSTSVVRYSVYRARKKPKKNTDPDWDIFIGNIIASTEGAKNGSAEAATMALVTGIAQNQ